MATCVGRLRIRTLDVGVSDIVNDDAYVLERDNTHQNNVTACGLGAGVQFKKALPLVHYVQIATDVRRRSTTIPSP